MDKSCPSYSTAGSTPATSTNDNTNESCSNASSSGGGTGDQYLKHLNKLSHKISKPITRKSTFGSCQPEKQSKAHDSDNQQQPQPFQQQALQHQPPVYNINKNDFRDVVQKLTGSPAHERSSNPQPIQQPKPQSSRLQRIRPPPLAEIGNRPPDLLQPNIIPLSQPSSVHEDHLMNTCPVNNIAGFGRPAGPLSPLPPFPTVHGAAESPISAYMRFLRSSMTNFDPSAKQFSGFSPLAPLVSPRWNSVNQKQSQPEAPPQLQQHLPPPMQQEVNISSSTTQPQAQFHTPPSPLPFGCLNSPRSPYPMLSPGLLGFPQLPLSPTVPVPSPRWRGL